MRYEEILNCLKGSIERRIKDSETLIENLKAKEIGKEHYYKTQKAKDRDIGMQEMFLYAMNLVKEDIEFYEQTIVAIK